MGCGGVEEWWHYHTGLCKRIVEGFFFLHLLDAFDRICPSKKKRNCSDFFVLKKKTDLTYFALFFVQKNPPFFESIWRKSFPFFRSFH